MGATMVLMAVGLVMMIIVTNVFFRQELSDPPPRWLLCILCLPTTSQNDYNKRPVSEENYYSQVCYILYIYRPGYNMFWPFQVINHSVVPMTDHHSGGVEYHQNNVNKQKTRHCTTTGMEEDGHSGDSTSSDARKFLWRSVAARLDMIFFLLYILISLLTFAAVFYPLTDKSMMRSMMI